MKTLLLSLLLLFSTVLTAGNDKYLVRIDLNTDYKSLNIIESLQLPVFLISREHLVTLADKEQLGVLNESGISFNQLAGPENADYFLISRKDKGMLRNDIQTPLLYSDIYNAVTAGAGIDRAALIRNGYTVSSLKVSNFFRNESSVILPGYSANSDSLIGAITALINKDSVEYFIQKLQDFGTRFLFAPNRDSVSEWIKSEFIRMGYTDVELDSFQYDNTTQKNVVATLTGTTQPDKYIVTGGHHDSYSSGNAMVFAPGADDNASGTAAVLETARVLKAAGYQPSMTIKFITFAAEEYGLWGSKDYALKALNENMDIKLMINHDMISNTSYPAAQSTVDINYYTGSESYRELAKLMAGEYSILTARNGSPNSSGSDSHSFWQRGFKAVYFEETNFSPYYHSPNDIITNYNMEYCAEVIKASCATLLSAIIMPDQVKNFFVYDPGNGTSIFASWSPNTEPDVNEYKIYVGTSSGSYYTSFTTADTTAEITGLTSGTQYYIAIAAVNQLGNEGLPVERNIIPYAFPQAPAGVTAVPEWLKVDLKWLSNNELDLQGYNVYRSAEQTGSYVKLNPTVLADTFYTDNTALNGLYYFYYIKAVDLDANESTQSNVVKSRVVSLDQGILIVDETEDGNGTLMNPTDQEVDGYYSGVLDEFRLQMHDINAAGVPQLADLGAFSTVIWSGEDLSNTTSAMAARDILTTYMQHGGNFLYIGYKPSRAFYTSVVYPHQMEPGSFLYDMLKVRDLEFTVYARFSGGIPAQSEYNSIITDTLKTLPLYLYHLSNIESIGPAPSGSVIYTYDTRYDSGSAQASMKGLPVGVEYIGNDYKAVTLSFPLYYMDQEQAKELLTFILTEKFNELTDVEDQNASVPSEFRLYQNYPNPFNPATSISYEMPFSGRVNISVFDILGREMTVLVDEVKSAGRYSIRFEATDFSSGIYFYRMQVTPSDNNSAFVNTRKMILLK